MGNDSTREKRDDSNSVTPETMPILAWNEANVITTDLLAKLYGTDPDSIRHNFNRNLLRFENGKHYHKLEGHELRMFKNSMTDCHAVQKRAKSVILWTERGAARHAKMLETDQAWDVFEKLEDCYFKRELKEELVLGDPSSVRDRLPLLVGVAQMVVMHHLSFSTAYRAVNDYAGVLSFRAMSKGQAKDAAGFVQRHVAGDATQRDFARIDANRLKREGMPSQTALLQL